MEQTLENYLRGILLRGIIDFQERARVENDNRVTFYIHPDSVSGETADFEVCGNTLAHNRDIGPTP